VSHPLIDGGDVITHYRIEWNTSALFASEINGAALGVTL
jgi:hypothetical protein